MSNPPGNLCIRSASHTDQRMYDPEASNDWWVVCHFDSGCQRCQGAKVPRCQGIIHSSLWTRRSLRVNIVLNDFSLVSLVSSNANRIQKILGASKIMSDGKTSATSKATHTTPHLCPKCGHHHANSHAYKRRNDCQISDQHNQVEGGSEKKSANSKSEKPAKKRKTT